MEHRVTLFQRLIGSPRHPWMTLGGALALLLIPFALAYFGGYFGDLPGNDSWRGLLVAPVVIIYILAIAPRLERMGKSVLNALRSSVLVDDGTYDRIVLKATTVSLRDELLAIGVGLIVGVVSAIQNHDGAMSWLDAYWFLTSSLMYALLAWTIYVSIASSRVTGALLRQPLRVDPLDITPFEAIGRESLFLALVFIGGMTLSLLFSVLNPAILSEPGFWLVYVPLALVPVTIFFLNMQPTHAVLAKAKATHLKAVQSHLKRASIALLERMDIGQDTGSLGHEITALAALEKRLQTARTWPYNTAMLRTLFVSVFIPVFTMLARWVIDQYFS